MEKKDQPPQMSEGEKELRKEFPRLEPRLYGQALTLTKHDHMRAEDLVQKTFVRALRHIRTYTPGSHIGSWLHRVLQNIYFSELRAEKRERAPTALQAEKNFEYHPDVEALSPEEATYAGQRATLVAELPSRLLEIVTLLSDGTSFEDIAKKMNISKHEAVKLGREALKVLTEREGEALEQEVPIIKQSDSIFDHLTLEQIQEYLQHVSHEQREAFVACALEGKKYKDAAAQLQISLGTLKSRVFRATERIIKLSGIQLKEKLSAFERCQDAAQRVPKRFLMASRRLTPVYEQLVKVLVRNPDITFEDLAREMKMSKSTLSGHVLHIVQRLSSSKEI